MLSATSGSDTRIGASTSPATWATTAAARRATLRASDYAADWTGATPPGPTPSPTPGVAPSPTPTGSPTPATRPAASPSATPSPTPSPTPGPSPQPAPSLTPAQAAAQRAELQSAQVDATLAEDVYHADAVPPAGYHVADTQELSRLGLTPGMLAGNGTNFRAQVYVGPQGRTVVAFKGTEFSSLQDWKNNAEQAIGADSPYYDRAIDIGQRIARSGVAVTFTGHSLGGGMASAAAIASGDGADSFNAAGLSGHTIEEATAANRAAGQGGRAGHVDAYFDGGDPLSNLQDQTAVSGGFKGALLGGLIGALAGPEGIVVGALAGGGVGAGAGSLPSAYGDRHELATIDPPGGPGLNPFAKHSMDYVDRGLNAALADLPPQH